MAVYPNLDRDSVESVRRDLEESLSYTEREEASYRDDGILCEADSFAALADVYRYLLSCLVDYEKGVQ